MKTLEIVTFCVAGVYLLVYIIFLFFQKHPIKTFIYNAIMGWLLLAVIDLLAVYTGVYIPINPYSVSVSGAGGCVGVLLLLALRIIVV